MALSASVSIVEGAVKVEPVPLKSVFETSNKNKEKLTIVWRIFVLVFSFGIV